jgi:hypothetical protein
MERCYTAGGVLLLMSFLCSLQSVNLLAQPGRSGGVSLIRTVFQGAGNPYRTALSGEAGLMADAFEATDRVGGAALPWRYKIVVTVFWVGEQPSEQNPISNVESAWDADWVTHFGGEDDPILRLDFMPLTFVPNLNPFYVALPYNDVCERHTKPDAVKIIPWFNAAFVRDGESVCKGRWVAIRHGKRICYAQWEDVGPYETDHWQYVFGNERPRPNANHDAGIDVSPAVRDYLGLSGMDVCDWRFVNTWEVPDGPWTLHGNDNTVARLREHLRNPKSKRSGIGPEVKAATTN